MFTKQDIEIMSLPYFDILFASDDHYEIKSICTGHSWKLIPKGSNCILQHKHHDSDEYHFQSGWK